MTDDERTEGEEQAAAGEPEAPVSAPRDEGEAKPKRRRTAKAAKDEAAEEKPKRRRAAKAEKDDEGEEKPKRRRAAKADKGDEAEAKPRRRRRAATADAEDAPTETPRARRTARKDADAADDKPKPRSRRTAKKEEEPSTPDRAATADDAGEEEDAAAAERPATPAPAPPRRERAPVRGRRREPAADGRVVVRATAKYVRSSARKARLVCDLIRGKSVDDARAILATATRSVARDWSKLLESAVANAENNHELDGDDLRILAVHADEGPTLKRYRPRAMGRATRIRKRTSHLSIQLTSKE